MNPLILFDSSGNHSTGKMGLAIAEECISRGAEVHLILGPSALKVDNSNIIISRVKSGEEMFQACALIHKNMDVCVFAASSS